MFPLSDGLINKQFCFLRYIQLEGLYRRRSTFLNALVLKGGSPLQYFDKQPSPCTIKLLMLLNCHTHE